jgi:hypothetical protein
MAYNGFLEPNDFGYNIANSFSEGRIHLYAIFFEYYMPQYFNGKAQVDQYLKFGCNRQVYFTPSGEVYEQYYMQSHPSFGFQNDPAGYINGWMVEEDLDAEINTTNFSAYMGLPKSNNPKYVTSILSFLNRDSAGTNQVHGLHFWQQTDYEIDNGSDWGVFALAIDKSAGSEQWDPYEAVSSFHIKELLIQTYNRLTYECRGTFDFPLFGAETGGA